MSVKSEKFSISIAKNLYKCFNLKDIVIMTIVLSIFTIPFISIALLHYNGSYNVINWKEYYNDRTNYSYYLDGVHDPLFGNTSDNQQFQIASMYNEISVPIGGGKTYKNTTFASQKYEFIMNKSSDLTFVSQYEFEPRLIQDYYPFLFGLPISLISNYKNYYYCDHLTCINYTTQTINTIIPSNWSDVWDNLEVYFYYIKADNEGVAFSFGNNESNTNEFRMMNLITNYGNLHLRTFDLNVSGEFRYVDSVNTPITITYHDKTLNNQTVLALIGNFFLNQFERQGGIGAIFGSIPDYVDVTQTFNYDSTLMEVNQIRGFPTSMPLITAEKCGYYIKVKQDFNITQYFETSGYNMTELSNVLTEATLRNGLSIYDGGLYLGNHVTLLDSIQKVLIYDLIILFSIFGLLIITMMGMKYPEQLETYRKTRINSCVIQ